MGGHSDRMLAAIEHRIIEQAKERWGKAAAGRTFADVLREVAVDQHEVRNGSVAVEIVGGPGERWRINVDHAELDDRAP